MTSLSENPSVSDLTRGASAAAAAAVQPRLRALDPAQQARIDRFAIPATVDIHCHCLPGLDDGPDTIEEALAMCRALVADGTTTVVATPHQLGPYLTNNGGLRIRGAVAQLNAVLTAQRVPLRVVPGADVRIDERVLPLLEAGEVLPVGPAGRYLLLELPHETLVDAIPLAGALAERGIEVVLTHPERHPVLARRPEVVASWAAAGIAMQVTAGSLLGEFGGLAERAAWWLLEQGLAGLVASDAHGADQRPPRMTQAITTIEAMLGLEVARRTALENPLRVVRGQDLLPAPAQLERDGDGRRRAGARQTVRAAPVG